MKKKLLKIILWSVAGLFAVAVMAILYVGIGGISNPGNRKTIGAIRPPVGFERVNVMPDSFGEFIREFPLQKRGSHLHHFDGSLAFMQYWGFAVLDLPMISNNEQCADAIMRMHSEYLWSKGTPGQSHFLNCSGEDVLFSARGHTRAFFPTAPSSVNIDKIRIKNFEVSKIIPIFANKEIYTYA